MSLFDFLKPKTEETGMAAGERFSDEWLRSVISELSDAVIAYDGDFKILIFNKTAEKIFGLTAAEVMGQTVTVQRANEPRMKLLTQVIFPSLAPRVQTLTEQGVYPQIVDLDMDNYHLRVTTNKITTPGGAGGFTKVIRDRTRETEILRSKSEFITIAAHQLRTPLTAINWTYEALGKDATLSTETQELVKTGSSAAKKLLKIVNDLLDVAKLEGGKFGYNFQEGDFAAFIDQVTADAKPLADTYGVKLFFDRPGEPMTLTFDQEKLAIALSNLVDNAIKYNVPNGVVTVRLQSLADQPYALVSVQDTGVGIPPEDMKKLFTKFFRAENVMQFATEGSGLGLYLVKNIILRHGGKIWAESELNRGTTFYFTLPTDPKLIPQKEMLGEEE